MKRHFLTLTLAMLMTVVAAAAFAATSDVPAGLQSLMSDKAAHFLGMGEANGPIAEVVTGMYNMIYWICLGIYILVQGIIIYCIVAFRKSKRRSNKDAKQFSHHVGLEIFWTVIPTLICIFIGWKALEGIQYMRTMPKDAVNIDVIAYRFGWDFDYQDYNVSVPEAVDPDPAISVPGTDRLVKELVVPQGKNVVLSITAKDVIHAFFVPSLRIKTDAVPGRINYLWFRADHAGDFLGQCAELCGGAHGEMFFRVKVVPEADFEKWVNMRRQSAGLTPAFVDGKDVAALAPATSVQ